MDDTGHAPQSPRVIIGGPPPSKECMCCGHTVNVLYKNYRGTDETGIGSSWECIYCYQYNQILYDKVSTSRYNTERAIEGKHIWDSSLLTPGYVACTRCGHYEKLIGKDANQMPANWDDANCSEGFMLSDQKKETT